ncbi:hypothetical protein GUITHDRAFT_145880 [Guillardia theta CCMP2712]|uniref:CBM20 domain-containing protein n=1 Tax=Guillardia theta (strain CCMP2712) TaxID=905079 RepID=L1IJ98_GUITC|nr:hypothetical protein GUITHDRAFT_145880 [Guillardia theta CCMP2712]EKX36313.1 hypothetical protein GUITHDRAFT_145880 [Guillardia theta CCMP2712]|eukprot:XP_005823293.1 hypothetical protein GUITHDRAFT_145880 [Guillardia theta CCMP2712]
MDRTLKRNSSHEKTLNSNPSSGGLPTIPSGGTLSSRTNSQSSIQSFTGNPGGSANDLSRPPVSATPKARLSRPSSREQILNEFKQGPDSQMLKLSSGSGRVVTNVEFQVTANTEVGDLVVVTGSSLELGSWEPRNGVVLSTDNHRYPMWSAIVDLPTGQTIEYKYSIIKQDGTVTWENDIENRMITPEGTSVVLDDGRFNSERARLLNKKKQSLEKGKKDLGKHFLELQANLDKSDTIYIITYRLPLSTHRDPVTGKYSFEWLSQLSDSKLREMDNTKVMRSMSRHATYVIENLRDLRSRCNVWYVGGLGIEVSEEDQEQVEKELAEKFQCIPVFLPRDMASEFEDFCHDILKPVFHFFHPTNRDMCCAFSAGAKWQLYNAVNLRYVTPVVQNFNDGDIVFVFDLELLMAPTLIGSRARTANVCFFFNTPFPSSEIFRTLPIRKQILNSLLNSNFIQFHDYNYTRHFLSCCSTLLGIEHRPTRGGLMLLVFNGHHCYIRACHVGIDAPTLCERLKEPQVSQELENWKAKFAESGKQVILCGYDDLEPLTGITLKLSAFRNILNGFPEYRKNLLLIQVAIPLHDSRGELMHKEYVNQVHAAAELIEKEYPGSLMLLTEKMPFGPRCALFAQCDALVMASVRHGLSLVPFEFVLCNEYGGKKGSLVVSEFAACSRVIPGAMRTNPFRDEDFAKAIVKCLRQPPHERQHYHLQQVDWCKTHTVERWAETILLDMKRVRESMILNGEDVKRAASCRVGLVKSTYKEISSNVLKADQVLMAYSEAKTRLLLIDVDLLIRPKEEMGDVSKDQCIRSLQQLVQESGNLVFLLSSETPENLLKWLGTAHAKAWEQMGLAAEDGYYYKWPGSPLQRWDVRMEVRADWKEVCRNVMEAYAERTTGTFIEGDKVASITWHYGSTNPEFGALQGKELLNHLEDTMAHLPVEVVMGKSFVRVRHEGVTKGAITKHLMSHITDRGGVDFILCLGDDRMDEGPPLSPR